MLRGLALLATIVLAGACARPVPDVSADRRDGPPVAVWVLDHGWHTAVVVRRTDVDRTLWSVADEFPAATFLEVAWGDRDFYMAPRPGVWLALKAALDTRGSVLHVVGFDSPLGVAFPRSASAELRLDHRGFEALIRFIADEHERGADGAVVRLGPGLYGSSWFYAARSRYSLSNTCNTWVARALQVAGAPVTASGVVTAGDLMRQLVLIGGSEAPLPPKSPHR